MNLPYNRRDYNSIFDYLKNKAKELSENRWTDFSEGDIGTIMIHLMSYLADMNNYNIDSVTNELFLSTALERSSIMSILSLIGYKPRHFESAVALINIEDTTNTDTVVIPAFTSFSDEDDAILYTTLFNQTINGVSGSVVAYEGQYKKFECTLKNIDANGRIFLPEYNVAFNTVSLTISTVSSMESILRVEDVRFNSGDMCFSMHVNREGVVYVQLPAYWKDIIDTSSSIIVRYLVTNGEKGRVGAEKLTKVANAKTSSQNVSIYNPEPSEGGYNPETADELKVNAPIAARTMYSIVTINDFEDVSKLVEEIAQVKAFDYNDPISGYIQPDDYYKVLLYGVPENPELKSLYKDDGTLNGAGEIFKNYIDERRVASLFVTYADPKYLTPDIDIDIYMNPNDLRVESVATSVVAQLKSVYGRKKTKIGQSIYGSKLGATIHFNNPYVDYCEVHSPEFNILCGPTEFIDMENANYTIRVNDVQKYPVVTPEDLFKTFRCIFAYDIDYKMTGNNPKTIVYMTKEDYDSMKPVYPTDIKFTWDGDVMCVRMPIAWVVDNPYKEHMRTIRLEVGESIELPHGEIIDYISSADYTPGMLPKAVECAYDGEGMILNIPEYYYRSI